MTTTAPSPVHARPSRVEPGGIEAIPASARHGSPWQLAATWTAPNLEFATIYVGVIAVLFFGLDFRWAMIALIIGNALGSITQGILSTWGPREGLAQLVLSRTAFGFLGNILPAGINTIMAGLGWFATNSVSGALALSTLTGMSTWLALIIVVVLEVAVAFVGHDLVQVFERYASYILGIIFLIATIVIFSHAHLEYTPKGGGYSFAGFTLTVSAAFGYAAGWNPYASDYTRYLPASASRRTAGWAAGIGDFVSCTVLMAAGAAAVTIGGFDPGDPTGSFTSSLPVVIRDLTLIAIAVGAIAANSLNIYSGAMSFLAAGVRIRFGLRRAIVAVGFGIIGFFVALWALPDAGEKYENFLLVIAYWIAPWLGVVFADRILRRGTSIAQFIPDRVRYRNWAGITAFLIGGVLSVWLFSNQTFYEGPVAKATPVGDLTPLVGFVVAFVAYFLLFRVAKPAVGGPLAEAPDTVIGVDGADDVA
ncbi:MULTISPECIES: cytosine permease [unclassified Curtobacterium]|uniref:purine-cytosine permease family protein n=1 Tax=unclassified Curtobacterium TaxID=257496 RepID=UPI000DAA6632|nr:MULTISPECIES: cytosine permease [unclassified Curtobacterium]WIB62810.1 cytosine permease [Curtobacterium sp. MCBD17_040]WIB66648.1 cytosine permease [Curtobacterium sp. MCBD17_035]